MACLKVLRLGFALPAVALGLGLLVLPSAQPHGNNPGALTQQQKTPAGPQLKVPIQKVQIPAATLTLTPSPENPIVNQNVRFTASWSRPVNVDNYHFSWGDGKFMDTDQPFADHPYAEAKTYTVFVVATRLVNDQSVAIGRYALNINVSPEPTSEALPPPTLTANPLSVRLGEPIRFTASIDPRAGPPQYDFFFDDNTHQPSDSNEFVYTYRQPGTFHPYVVAVLGHGDMSVTGGPIDVTVAIPRLTLTSVTKEPTVGQWVAVCAELDTPSKNVHYEFTWDDKSGSEQGDARGCARHVYAAANTYTVQVRAWTDATENYPSSAERPIVVGESTPQVTPTLIPPRPPPLPWRLIALVVVLVGAGAVIGWKLWKRARMKSQPTPELRVTGHPGASSHEISQTGHGVPYLSITLVPGSDPEQHRITFL